MAEYEMKEYKQNSDKQREYWNAAIGLQDVDELKPSKYLYELSERNTRTTAVFIELYLNSIGFSVNNDMFKEYSRYYRNALVRSNYADYSKGVDVDFSFLEKFYANLLFDEEFELKNDDMVVDIRLK